MREYTEEEKYGPNSTWIRTSYPDYNKVKGQVEEYFEFKKPENKKTKWLSDPKNQEELITRLLRDDMLWV